MFKKTGKIFFWISIISGWIVLSGFVSNFYQDIKLKKVQINFIEDNHHEFITKSEVNSILSSMGIVEKVTLKHEINFFQIERKLLNHSAINSAEVYFNNNGNLVVYIRKRTPIARFVSPVFEKNFYVDDNGYLMPICSTYVSRVPVFSGKINIPDALNFYDLDSLHKSLDFQRIYKMSKLINNDSFLKSQIVQIYINNNGYFELIPRIGNQRILFGSTENMEKKFKKIKLFYKNGPQPKDLNKYDTLNLIYENQIICSKRN
jgi:cell division protein FtsQ